jgi:hypothetical protein
VGCAVVRTGDLARLSEGMLCAYTKYLITVCVSGIEQATLDIVSAEVLKYIIVNWRNLFLLEICWLLVVLLPLCLQMYRL